MLALRVTKTDPHEGHDHAKPAKDSKRVKGLWTVKVEREQEFDPMMHYVWVYEGPQWKQKALAAGVLVVIMAVVMFPLWPIMLRQGVWYLSIGMMGLIGLFFLMAIFRLILFCVTVFVVPPGLWLYPNLFEDVGFFDSFRPLWGWQEVRSDDNIWWCALHLLTDFLQTKKSKKGKKAGKSSTTSKNEASSGEGTGVNATAQATRAAVTKRHRAPQVEEADDD
jgi:translocation protein SEC62